MKKSEKSGASYFHKVLKINKNIREQSRN